MSMSKSSLVREVKAHVHEVGYVGSQDYLAFLWIESVNNEVGMDVDFISESFQLMEELPVNLFSIWPAGKNWNEAMQRPPFGEIQG